MNLLARVAPGLLWIALLLAALLLVAAPARGEEGDVEARAYEEVG